MAKLISLPQDTDAEYNLKGYEAKDSADNKVGKIDGVIADANSMQPRYMVVDSGGLFSSKKYVVPVGDVAQIDDDKKHVYFKTLNKSILENGKYPNYDESWMNSEQGSTQFATHEREIARTYEPQRPATKEVDYNDKLYKPAEGVQRLQLLEEHLTANKERYQADAVQVGKRVVERQETVNVPVTEERVIIERTATTGQTAGGTIGDSKTIEVPVMKERVTVEKETNVAEEVNIRKEATQRTERVQDTVRREELDVKDGQRLVTESGRSSATDTGRSGMTDAGRTVDSATTGTTGAGRTMDQGPTGTTDAGRTMDRGTTGMTEAERMADRTARAADTHEGVTPRDGESVVDRAEQKVRDAGNR